MNFFFNFKNDAAAAAAAAAGDIWLFQIILMIPDMK